MSAGSHRVVVIGGGTMGAGIAQVVIQAGVHVTLVEVDGSAASKAASRVENGLCLAHKRAPDADEAVASDMERLSLVTDFVSEEAPSLVIEAVPEDPGLKAKVLGTAASAWRDTIIATNTSSLPVGQLAESVVHPGRFIGMHFFNPVPRSELVELVVGPATKDMTIEAAKDWVARLAKESIVVSDSPGFATSRLGIAIGLEAIRMLEEGVASASDIDKGMVLGYKFPIGPLRLTDLVGLDVRLAIAEHLASALGPRFDPPRLLREKVSAGELGRKSGKGFFEWPAD